MLELARRYAGPRAARRSAQRTLCALSKRNSSLAAGPGCCASCKSCNCIRAAVSLKKRRFVRAGFDMDLSYITDRIIAMGFPSRGCESCYRNSAASTHDFMEQRHPGRFRIWNLCSEAGRSYSKDLFMGSVVEIGFLDHNAPRMEQVEEFCRGVDEWLAAHPDNVAAVHCKAGKGRTGTMIAAYLVWSGAVDSAAQALDLYAKRRTYNNKGVTIPSQRRFVRYTEVWLRAKARAGARIINEHEERMEAAVEAAAEADVEAELAEGATDAEDGSEDGLPEVPLPSKQELAASSTAAAALLEELAEEEEQEEAQAKPGPGQSDSKAGASADASEAAGIGGAGPQAKPSAAAQRGDRAASSKPAHRANRSRHSIAADHSDAVNIGPWAPDSDPSVLPARPVRLVTLALSCMPKTVKGPVYVAVFDHAGALLISSAAVGPADGTFRDSLTGVALSPSRGGIALGEATEATPGEGGVSSDLLNQARRPKRCEAIRAAAASAGHVHAGSVPAAVPLLRCGFPATSSEPTGAGGLIPMAAKAAAGNAAAPTGQRVAFASKLDDKHEESLIGAAARRVAPAAAAKDAPAEIEMAALPSSEPASPARAGAAGEPDTAGKPFRLAMNPASLLCPGDGFQSNGYDNLLYALPRQALSRRLVSGAIKVVLLTGPTADKAKAFCWFWVQTAFLPFPTEAGGSIRTPSTESDSAKCRPAAAAAAAADGAAAKPGASAGDAALEAEAGAGDAKTAGGDSSPVGDADEPDGAGPAGPSIVGPELGDAAESPTEDDGPQRVGWLHLPREDLDKASKDHKGKVFPANFAITLFYEARDPADDPHVRALDMDSAVAAVAARAAAETAPAPAE
ncbi:hypothetical protein FNF27_07354 [Cafeteria roenbergensis]|uniref:Phosphatidylinositol-3,4,5-trisphosphate 3-phosphatase n=1 Tax=Cafeteria roenbergensis TaxID=33653 RepID=A0A5A8DTZ6_CAFRO|nr:hypothetical protein FNF27_07354 [Cafeteria roenbergensis]